LAPAELLQSAIGRTKRPDVYVSDILDPHRTPRRVYHDDQAPLAIVNRKGEPRRVFPTLVSFARSYAFKDNGPGLVWDSIMQEMVEPNADYQCAWHIRTTTAVLIGSSNGLELSHMGCFFGSSGTEAISLYFD
jgi:hypothetical protein